MNIRIITVIISSNIIISSGSNQNYYRKVYKLFMKSYVENQYAETKQ